MPMPLLRAIKTKLLRKLVGEIVMSVREYMKKITGFLLGLSICFPALLHGAEVPPADVVPFAGLSPQDACDKASLPPGFKMHVFAAEPDVRQPIAFCLDHRGRVWVVEGVTYP